MNDYEKALRARILASVRAWRTVDKSEADRQAVYYNALLPWLELGDRGLD